MSAPSTDHHGAALQALNTMPRTELVSRLRTCLDVRRWADEIADSRPFSDVHAVHAAADRAAQTLALDEIHTALAAHPRIGDRADGEDTESVWSRGEQGGVDASDAALARALREGNVEYERRFGHVYLVCASGLSGTELLDRLHSRLDNDRETETAIVADELRKIARLRLDKVIAA